jgi:hypothetical protein
MDALPLMQAAPMPMPASGQPLMQSRPQQLRAVVLTLSPPPPCHDAQLAPALWRLALAQMVVVPVAQEVALLPMALMEASQ